MLEKIVKALEAREDLSGWTVRHMRTRGAQVYAVPRQIEARRAVDGERFVVDLLRQTKASDGSPALGSADVTVLPGEDIDRALDDAALVAGLTANPVHTLPAPAPIPDVELLDPELEKDPSALMNRIVEELRSAAAEHPEVRLTAGECFGDIRETHLVNSRGIDAHQTSGSLAVEFVLQGREGERETETFRELTRRRASDLRIESEIEENVRHTLDSLKASPPRSWQGPVVLRGETLVTFVAGDDLVGSLLQTLGSASSKYAKLSSWEIGESVFRGEVKGDPFTLWANRQIPFGTTSNRFDEEGLPAGRVELIRENRLVAFSTSQRYADYLNLPPTGAFGGVEIPAGTTPAADLLAEPHVEVVLFSWFNPDPITGDFATEIRLGYFVENGQRRPFRGGQLVGNVLDGLADVRWSSETGFFGNYLGPHTARFNNLKVTGSQE